MCSDRTKNVTKIAICSFNYLTLLDMGGRLEESPLKNS